MVANIAGFPPRPGPLSRKTSEGCLSADIASGVEEDASMDDSAMVANLSGFPPASASETVGLAMGDLPAAGTVGLPTAPVSRPHTAGENSVPDLAACITGFPPMSFEKVARDGLNAELTESSDFTALDHSPPKIRKEDITWQQAIADISCFLPMPPAAKKARRHLSEL
jgi:hypothetical protein